MMMWNLTDWLISLRIDFFLYFFLAAIDQRLVIHITIISWLYTVGTAVASGKVNIVTSWLVTRSLFQFFSGENSNSCFNFVLTVCGSINLCG